MDRWGACELSKVDSAQELDGHVEARVAAQHSLRQRANIPPSCAAPAASSLLTRPAPGTGSRAAPPQMAPKLEGRFERVLHSAAPQPPQRAPAARRAAAPAPTSTRWAGLVLPQPALSAPGRQQPGRGAGGQAWRPQGGPSLAATSGRPWRLQHGVQGEESGRREEKPPHLVRPWTVGATAADDRAASGYGGALRTIICSQSIDCYAACKQSHGPAASCCSEPGHTAAAPCRRRAASQQRRQRRRRWQEGGGKRSALVDGLRADWTSVWTQ